MDSWNLSFQGVMSCQLCPAQSSLGLAAAVLTPQALEGEKYLACVTQDPPPPPPTISHNLSLFCPMTP